jgi:translation initiation factor eIF-2B subunit gamma
MVLEPSASLGGDPSSSTPATTAASFEVVILAGGYCPRLHPLTTPEKPKALLPLVNAPLLSYPLRAAAEAGVRRATVAAIGEQAAARIRDYLSSAERPASTLGVECEVVAVPGDAGTAGALRAVAPRLLERMRESASAAAEGGNNSASSPSSTVLVYPADLVTDVPLRAFAAAHAAGGNTGAAAAVGAGRAVATVLLGRRRTSPSSEVKPGRPPRNVDYLGLDAARQSLLFAAPSPEALREIRLPLAVLAVGGGAGAGGILGAGGALELRSDLVDLHLYAFDVATVLPLLLAGPAAAAATGAGAAAAAPAAATAASSSSSFLSLKLDFLPYLARMASSGRLAAAVERAQQRLAGAAPAAGAAGGAAPAPGGAAAATTTTPTLLPLGGGGGGEADSPFPYAAMCHSYTGPVVGSGVVSAQQQQQQQQAVAPASAAAAANNAPATPPPQTARNQTPTPLRVAVHFVPDACYAARVNTVPAYCDASRDLAAPDGALRLTGLVAGRHGNVVPQDAQLGTKATVGPACVVGTSCTLGDRASVKRSVVGKGVSVGAGAKVVNCILLDSVSVGAGASVHGCVLACGSSVGAGSMLKDCQVGAGVVIPPDAEHTGEAMAAAAAAAAGGVGAA